jgi:hypothetical protein
LIDRFCSGAFLFSKLLDYLFSLLDAALKLKQLTLSVMNPG